MHILRTFLIGALVLGSLAPAQSQSFGTGTKVLHLGLGAGGAGRYSYLGTYGGSVLSPMLNGSFDVGVADIGPGVLGIGGYFGFRSSKYQSSSSGGGYQYTYDRRWTNIILGARGNWHWNDWHNIDQLDVYAGVMLGYNIGGYKDKSTTTFNGQTVENTDNVNYNLSFVTWSNYVGAHWYFTDLFGVYAELGFGATNVNAGAALRF